MAPFLLVGCRRAPSSWGGRMTGRPPLYPEESKRLHVTVRASVAERLQQEGHAASRFVDMTLDAFLKAANDKAGLLEELMSIKSAFRELQKAGDKLRATRDRSLDEILRIRREASDLSRSVTQRLRSAPPGERPGLVQLLRRVRRIAGDSDIPEPAGSTDSRCAP